MNRNIYYCTFQDLHRMFNRSLRLFREVPLQKHFVQFFHIHFSDTETDRIRVIDIVF